MYAQFVSSRSTMYADRLICIHVYRSTRRQTLVMYFVPDDLGGYQKEEKSYYIDPIEILKPISRPEIKRIGRSRKTFLFRELCA